MSDEFIHIIQATNLTRAMSQSPFLEIPPEKWLLSNELAFAVLDGFPVSAGHTLVLTKRLVASWFDASAEEQLALMSLVNDVKLKLDAMLSPKPDGYNVGFNSGAAAGQTVWHVHIHVIPRYAGDVPDPRGGVRHVIPDKGHYLTGLDSKPVDRNQVTPVENLSLTTGHPASQLWDQLSHRLIGAKQVDILAAFVQESGLYVIEQHLFELLRGESNVRILVGDYLWISAPAALKRLCDWQERVCPEEEYAGRLQVGLVEMSKLPDQPQSFHPKAWRIMDSQHSFIAVGSSNLSRAALRTGVEWNLLSTGPHELGVHQDFEVEFTRLWNIATPLTEAVVAEYTANAAAYRKVHFEPESVDERFVPDPRPWQQAALISLQRIRDAGYGRALVAVATGMGKTWLAAFDVRQFGEQFGRRPRVLVVAHRSHILVQAESALSSVLQDAFGPVTTSWYRLAKRLSGRSGHSVCPEVGSSRGT